MRKIFSMVIMLYMAGNAGSQQASSPPLVSFIQRQASSLDAIKAIAAQSHVPIGIIVGRHQRLLCSNKSDYNIQSAPAVQALSNVAKEAGYSVEQAGEVTVIIAQDLTRRQRELLDHRFDPFSADDKSTMAGLGGLLTGALWMGEGLERGFALSTLHSTTAEMFDLGRTTCFDD
jgi:hypothetical protein